MIQCNKLMNLEDSVVMYGIYNAQTFERCINTVHHFHNYTSQQGRALHLPMYANTQGIQHYSINSLLYLRTVKEKYILLYKEFIMHSLPH